MRKHGWQLPYHPLQVSLSLSLQTNGDPYILIFAVLSLVPFFNLWVLNVWCAGSSSCYISSIGVCFLCLLCPICGEEILSIHCDGPLHSSCKPISYSSFTFFIWVFLMFIFFGWRSEICASLIVDLWFEFGFDAFKSLIPFSIVGYFLFLFPNFSFLFIKLQIKLT